MFDQPFDNRLNISKEKNEIIRKCLEIYTSKLLEVLKSQTK